MKEISKEKLDYDFGEIVSRNTIKMYYVRDGHLVGLMRTTSANGLDANLIRKETQLAIPEDASEFVKGNISSAIRVTKSLQMERIEVLNWKSTQEKNIELYTVNSPKEITVILFDSRNLSWRDFFVGAEIEQHLKDTRKRVENMLGGSERRSSKVFENKVSSIPGPMQERVSESRVGERILVLVLIGTFAFAVITFWLVKLRYRK